MESTKSLFARNFHLAGIVLIIAGIAGSVVSLFWDAIYRGRPFTLQSIGPLKIAGMVAGLIIINIGIATGFALAARKHPVQGKGPARLKHNPGLLLSGVILTVAGLGGILLSLLWDVISKKKPFNMDSIGPFKMAGILTGIILLAAGILLIFLGLRKVKVREPEIVEPIPVPDAQQEEIPFALPVGQAMAPVGGARPMEAIAVEETIPNAQKTMTGSGNQIS